jgi:hypothetical protein
MGAEGVRSEVGGSSNGEGEKKRRKRERELRGRRKG